MAILNKIEVWLNGQQVGTLALTPTRPQVCAFEYTDGWLKNGFSISPFELPLTPGVKIAEYKPFEGNFGVFNDSLPDGWGQLLLHRYLQTKGINSLNLSILEQLCLVGSNGRGALEFRPDRSIANDPQYSTFAQLALEADKILQDDDYTGGQIEELVTRGGSPGGARPKIFVHADGQEWLVKFRARYDKKDIGRQEYRYALLARECGIQMPEVRLFDNEWFGVERFDRKDGQKVHVVSAAGLLRADYQLPCMDYMHLFKLTSALTHSAAEMERLYRLMVFNVLIGNRDDHAKNFSFIYDNGAWSLSPAYDLLPCGAEGDYHTTSVDDNPNTERADVIRLGEKVGLSKQLATAIWEEMEKLIASKRLNV